MYDPTITSEDVNSAIDEALRGTSSLEVRTLVFMIQDQQAAFGDAYDPARSVESLNEIARYALALRRAIRMEAAGREDRAERAAMDGAKPDVLDEFADAVLRQPEESTS